MNKIYAVRMGLFLVFPILLFLLALPAQAAIETFNGSTTPTWQNTSFDNTHITGNSTVKQGYVREDFNDGNYNGWEVLDGLWSVDTANYRLKMSSEATSYNRRIVFNFTPIPAQNIYIYVDVWFTDTAVNKHVYHIHRNGAHNDGEDNWMRITCC